MPHQEGGDQQRHPLRRQVRRLEGADKPAPCTEGRPPQLRRVLGLEDALHGFKELVRNPDIDIRQTPAEQGGEHAPREDATLSLGRSARKELRQTGDKHSVELADQIVLQCLEAWYVPSVIQKGGRVAGAPLGRKHVQTGAQMPVGGVRDVPEQGAACGLHPENGVLQALHWQGVGPRRTASHSHP